MSDNAAYFYNKINEDVRTGGIDVRVEDIIDIIDGYKGGGSWCVSSTGTRWVGLEELMSKRKIL